MPIGERIREVRLSQPEKMSVEKFAERLGITKGSVSLIENEKNQPSDQTIRSVCREFNVNETWLRTGDGQMYADKDRAREMEELVQSLMADSPESFRSALITTLLRFRPDGPEWEVLERIYQSVAAAVPVTGAPADQKKAERASIHTELDRQLDDEERGASSA